MAYLTDAPTLALPVHEGDHVKGRLTARVAVVEYGDFECPSCAQGAPALQLMQAHFEPDVCLVFRHYPLAGLHPHATMAAEAAEAAAAQDRFWPMHDLLFRRALHFGRAEFNRCALAARLDMALFERAMDTQQYRGHVEADMESGTASGIMSTPAIFVNGRLCDVSFGMQHLHQTIEELLAGGS